MDCLTQEEVSESLQVVKHYMETALECPCCMESYLAVVLDLMNVLSKFR